MSDTSPEVAVPPEGQFLGNPLTSTQYQPQLQTFAADVQTAMGQALTIQAMYQQQAGGFLGEHGSDLSGSSPHAPVGFGAGDVGGEADIATGPGTGGTDDA